LLCRILQIARSIRLRPQFLNGIHDIGLLSYESFTQPLCPCSLVGHHGEDLRERRQRFYTQVPIHSVESGIERIPLEGRI
jgi:hypothetical protein